MCGKVDRNINRRIFYYNKRNKLMSFQKEEPEKNCSLKKNVQRSLPNSLCKMSWYSTHTEELQVTWRTKYRYIRWAIPELTSNRYDRMEIEFNSGFIKSLHKIGMSVTRKRNTLWLWEREGGKTAWNSIVIMQAFVVSCIVYAFRRLLWLIIVAYITSGGIAMDEYMLRHTGRSSYKKEVKVHLMQIRK